jgi:GNAT superfamily N-acetyltransferase
VPTLRDATPDDAIAIAGVHVRSWQGAYRGLIADEFLDRLRPRDRAGSYRLGDPDPSAPRTVVAEAGGEIWGFATTGPCRDTDARGAGELYALYVDPPHWGRGTGRQLLAAANERMRADGFAEAVRFYAAAGWRRDGAEREEQPYGVVSNVLRMRRSLSD